MFYIYLSISQCDDLYVFHRGAVDGHAHESSLHVPTLLACCTWVDVEESEKRVTLNFEDVTVAADEELWRVGVDLALDAAVVLARVTTDVLHEYIDIFTLEAQHLGEHATEVAAVAVAADGADDAAALRRALGKLLIRIATSTRLRINSGSLQTFDGLHGANIACMPNLVALLEVRQEFIVPIAVCVADDSYACHGLSYCV